MLSDRSIKAKQERGHRRRLEKIAD